MMHSKKDVCRMVHIVVQGMLSCNCFFLL